MRLTTSLVLLSIGTLSFGGRIHSISKKEEFSNLTQTTVEILERCYRKQLNTVGLSGSSDGLLIKELQLSTSFSTTLLDNTRRVVSHDPVQRTARYKLEIFVVTASSTTELEENLGAIKNSIWWNHMASVFVLVQLPVLEDECSEAFEMLSAAWKMNLINAKLMCLHRMKDILIYTFNPYTGMAPIPWKVEKTYRGRNGHPWTLFVRRYREDREVCEKLDFDKTKDAGGYGVGASVKIQPGAVSLDFEKKGKDQLQGDNALLLKDIFTGLNATPEFVVYNFTTAIGYNVEKGRDILMDVVDGISDIAINIRLTATEKATAVTYPFHYFGLVIVSQYRGELSQLNKLRSVVDNTSRIGIYLVIFITLLFFIIFLHQTLLSGLFNVVRIVCNGQLLTVPANLATRLYLCSFFIFIVTIQAIYQGRLATLLTKPVLLPNVNTVQDLADGNYTLYISERLAPFLEAPILKGRIVTHENFSCIDDVRHDPLIACATSYYWALRETAEHRLHISKDDIIRLPSSFPIREDWPLEQRLNKVLLIGGEMGIFKYDFMKNKYNKLLNMRKFYGMLDEQEQFKSITLDELSFAFAILGIGLGWATMCFMAEKGIELVRPKISTVYRYFKNRHRDINTKKSTVRN